MRLRGISNLKFLVIINLLSSGVVADPFYPEIPGIPVGYVVVVAAT